jgi:hypothetical protein
MSVWVMRFEGQTSSPEPACSVSFPHAVRLVTNAAIQRRFLVVIVSSLGFRATHLEEGKVNITPKCELDQAQDSPGLAVSPDFG